MKMLRIALATACAYGSVAAALLLTASCATAPATAEKIASVPMGTVSTYHRKSSGSLGDFDGKVVWTHESSTWQGKPAISFGAPQAGVALHDPASFGMLATLDRSGKPQLSFDPPVNYPWPLEVGKTWSTNHTVTVYASGSTRPFRIVGKVEAQENITVPAGTFKTYCLRWVNDMGEIETRWIGPGDGIATVRRHVERPATHPRGAGMLDAELLSRVLPTK